MKTELSVEIDRPIEEVFDYLHDHTVDWIESVVSDDVIREQNNGGYGTTFRVVTEERGQQMEFLGEITGWSRPRRSQSLLKGDAFDIDVEYKLESRSQGSTLVMQCSRVVPKSLMMKLMCFGLGWAMKGAGKRALRKDFATLKHQLESR